MGRNKKSQNKIENFIESEDVQGGQGGQDISEGHLDQDQEIEVLKENLKETKHKKFDKFGDK